VALGSTGAHEVWVKLVIPHRGPTPLAELQVRTDITEYRWRGNAATTCVHNLLRTLRKCERPPTGRRVVGDEAAYLILHQPGLVDLERHSRQRTYIVRVLDRKLAEKHVERVEEALRRLVERCG